MRKMKDSGIEWIGEIPEEWESNPLRQVIVSRDGGAWGDDPEEDNNAVICLRIADFDYEKAVFKNTPESELTYRKYTYIQKLRLTLKLGDILIEKSGGGEKTPVGRAVLFDKDCNALFANFMDRIRVNPAIVSASFVMYWLKALYSCQVTPYYIKQTTGIQNLDLTMLLAKERIMYPEINSQLSIVSYLDSKCSKIDGLVSDIEKQITTLEQYKRSVITEAVTKGLDPAVPMKDSEIEWIGEIPEEWNPIRLKYIANYNTTTLTENTNADYEFDYIDIGSVTYGKGIEQFQPMKFSDAPSRARRVVKPHDVIVSTVRTYLKAIAYVPEYDRPVVVSTGFLTLTAKPIILPKFLRYAVESEPFVSGIEANSVGISYPAINTSEAIKVTIILPPLSEQHTIAEYLDTKCSEIDSAISLKKQQIKALNDYKKSLIYEYVTGKKEIPA